MTASMAFVERQPRLAPVPDGVAPVKPGLYQQVSAGLTSVWSWVCKAPGRFWGWLKRVMHLQPVVDKIKEAVRWTVSGVRAFLKAMGFQGVAGLGMLAVSTSLGRWVIGALILTPLKWLCRQVGKAWRNTSSFFADNLGGAGNWIAARMEDVDTFLFGKLNAAGDGRDGHGLVGRVKGLYYRVVAMHWALNSVFMRVVRLVGTVLCGLKVVAALPLLGLAGSVLVYATYVAKAALFVVLAWQSYFLGEGIGQIPAVNKWVNKARSNSAAAAAEKATGNGKPKLSSLAEAAMASNYRDPRPKGTR